MNRPHPLAPLRRPLLLIAVCALAAISGCIYRPTIQQGNLLKVEDVDQVQVGMTRSQVRYILGTPMVSDPFQPERWDYVYTLQRGRDPHIDRGHFVVFFDIDKVTKVEKIAAAKTTAAAEKVRKLTPADLPAHTEKHTETK